MSNVTWSEEHSRLTAAAAPDVPPATEACLDRTWDRIAAAMDEPDRPRRHRTGVVLGAVAATVALSLGSAAVASVLSAHTGRYAVDTEDRRLGGPGERLDPAAPDYAAVVEEVTGDVPFPDTRSRALFRDGEVRDGQRSPVGTTLVSTGALRFWAARAAVCAWADEWASTEADPSATRRAATALEKAPGWPAVTDVDPVQTIRHRWVGSTDAATGRGFSGWVWDDTEAGYFPLVRAAVREGDRAELAAVLAEHGACLPALVPHFPQALPAGVR